MKAHQQMSCIAEKLHLVLQKPDQPAQSLQLPVQTSDSCCEMTKDTSAPGAAAAPWQPQAGEVVPADSLIGALHSPVTTMSPLSHETKMFPQRGADSLAAAAGATLGRQVSPPKQLFVPCNC